MLGEKAYTQRNSTSGLWVHGWHPIQFTLLVDDFGDKHVGDKYREHILDSLEEFYEILKDEKGTKYCGLTMDRDYDGEECAPIHAWIFTKGSPTIQA